jgi:nucleoside-diphosphate-sugar epimerase
MIVGSGLIARAFAPQYGSDPTTIIFASGVSNSSESDTAAFDRERMMVLKQLASNPERLLYFGSCNVNNPEQQSPYFAHKRAMEALVSSSDVGLVIRLPQVVGATPNPNTLTNHLHRQIVDGARVTVWKRAERNLIDIDDVAAITHHLLTSSEPLPPVISVASPWTVPMGEIVRIFESVLGRTANVVELERGERMHIDTSLAERAAAVIGIDFGPDYPQRVINKYYGNR